MALCGHPIDRWQGHKTQEYIKRRSGRLHIPTWVCLKMGDLPPKWPYFYVENDDKRIPREFGGPDFSWRYLIFRLLAGDWDNFQVSFNQRLLALSENGVPLNCHHFPYWHGRFGLSTILRQTLIFQFLRDSNGACGCKVIFRASFCRFILDSNLVGASAGFYSGLYWDTFGLAWCYGLDTNSNLLRSV